MPPPWLRCLHLSPLPGGSLRPHTCVGTYDSSRANGDAPAPGAVMFKLHYPMASARGDFPGEPACSLAGMRESTQTGASALVSVLGCPSGIGRGPLEYRSPFPGHSGCPHSPSVSTPGCGGLSPRSESIVVARTSSQVAGCVARQAVSGPPHLTQKLWEEHPFPSPSEAGRHTGSSVVSAWMPGHLRGALPAWVGLGSGACSNGAPNHSLRPHPFTLVTLGPGSQGGGAGSRLSLCFVCCEGEAPRPAGL